MNASDASIPSSAPAPANADVAAEHITFVAQLRGIGSGGASDGRPWPERQLAPAVAWPWPISTARWPGCAPCMHDIPLAAERARQDGGPEQDVGDRVVEGDAGQPRPGAVRQPECAARLRQWSGGAGRGALPRRCHPWLCSRTADTKNPEDCRLPGFLVTTGVVGETGFEPATSTSRT